jgi:hypothetical protein
MHTFLVVLGVLHVTGVISTFIIAVWRGAFAGFVAAVDCSKRAATAGQHTKMPTAAGIRQSPGSLQRSNPPKSPGFLLLLDAIATLLHAGGTRALCLRC